ncbi:hypothetical protein LJK88_22740 [Paenibacillus sp. P26]|nr:hypothetical protein LJK88_22740 [Paenibacillus sp. P26]UUZ95650.1 hypothetical protein LJK87_15135 [Paenibacillus sp. P25]
MDTEFRAWMVEEQDKPAVLKKLPLSELAAEDVHVRIHYSSINYKDALALTGKGKVVRQFPMIPGVDLAGKWSRAGRSTFPKGIG